LSVLAVTGGTGFVGRHLIRLALEAGHRVQALARQPQPEQPSLRWVSGALDSPASLTRLCQGADAVLHIAGVVNAPDRAGFAAGNIAGTEAIIKAAQAAGPRRFIHVSSLSAREPTLSDYGWSKYESEQRVRASGLDWTIVRPPAVYGPGDREMLELFRMADKGVVLLPPKGRLSLIEATDLARLLLALPPISASHSASYEPDDGVSGGWTHRQFALLIGHAVGRRVLPLSMPAGGLRVASRLEAAIRPGKAKLTRDRVRYFCHSDWVVTPGAQPSPDIWHAEIPTPRGLVATSAWYREQGWLGKTRR
jgi:uncharacterized protein YbjT (DUF2867 family)